jgi:hypothetical protein
MVLHNIVILHTFVFSHDLDAFNKKWMLNYA